MDTCVIEFFDSPVTKAIEAEFGLMKTAAANCLAYIAPTGELTPEFKTWYKNNYKRDINLNAKDAKTVAKRAIRYYNETAFNVDELSENYDDREYGYANVADIARGKNHIIDIAADIYSEVTNGLIPKEIVDENYVKSEIKTRWNNILFNRIALRKGVSIDSVKKDFNERDTNKYITELSWFRSQLEGEDYGIIDKNLLAVWCDLHSDTANKYLSSIFSSQKLIGLFKDNISDDEVQDNNTSDTTEGENTNPKVEATETDDTNKAITQANSHMGDYVTFTKHLSKRLKIYFNSLKKLADSKKANGNWVYDTNNSFGIPETMSAEECSKLLFANGFTFSNVDAMINRIEQLANTVPGFESFAKVAEDLSLDVDLANELFTIFAKTRISKVTLLHKNISGRVSNEFRESNSDSDKDTAMLFDLRNDIRYSISNAGVNPEAFDEVLTKYQHSSRNTDYLGQLIANYRTKSNKEQRAINGIINGVKKEVASIIRTYFPSITDAAIDGYINNANNSDGSIVSQVRNIQSLVTLLTQLNRNAKKAKQAYNKIQLEAEEFRKELSDMKKSGVQVSKSGYSKVSEIISQDFIEDLQANIFQIKNALVDYSMIEVNFNSTNANNKMSSDIINNSLITRIVKLLESGNNEVLERWGTDKLRSHHYKFSNIFVEKYVGGKDNNGMTRALFKQTPNGLKVTSYARDLFKLSLFDGAKNMDTGNSATYSQMMSGDFIPTTYGAFFNTNSSENNKTIPLASYFLRTPSDAPKTFVLRAPRYDTSDLYIYDNPEEIKKFINNVTKSITSFGENSFAIYNSAKDIIKENTVSLDKFKDILNNKATVVYNETSPFSLTADGKPASFIQIKIKDRSILLGVSGDVIERGGKKYLKNIAVLKYAEFLGKEMQPLIGNLSKDVKEVIENNIKWHLNRGHHTINGVTYENIPTRRMNTNAKVFNMLRDKAKQEIYNMLVAADYIFEHETDGRIKLERKDGVDVPVIKKDLDINSLYDFYDKDYKDRVFKIETDKTTGQKYVTLCGNVFNSNLFTLWVNEVGAEGNPTGRKYKRNYLMEMFTTLATSDNSKLNLLYGGANMIRAERDADGNVNDIYLSDDATTIINTAIENFVEDYLAKARRKIKENKQFISESTSEEDVANFALNYRIALMNYDELFEGSTKFYADSQTILKRAKEYQGSGIPYGVADYFEADSAEKHEVPTLLTKGSITEIIDGQPVQRSFGEIFKGTVLEGLKAYNKFNAITIFNSKDTNHSALKTLADKLVSIGVDRTSALELLYGKIERDENGEISLDENGNIISRGGFTGTKVNDAQSYITFKEWVRRVAAKGQLKQYLPLIRRIIEAEKKGEEVRVSDIKEFIQIQKNFYYDLAYDEKRKMERPRQIKNAEIVLIPSLVKGTQLEQVYNLMDELGIDQLNTKETSKAANHNVLRLWDNEGNISDKDIANFREKAPSYKEEYNYKYLYTQQETPQHLDAKNKAGIQLLKKMIDNIPDKGHPLSQAKADFLELMSENIYGSYKEVFDELDIKYASDGTIESMNKKVFFEKLRHQLETRGMDKNLFDCVDLDKDGIPKMPIIRVDILNTFESVIQSEFNRNITRQMLPGFHAAQGTNIGWRKLKNVVDARAYSKDLHYHQDKSGKYVHYIEVKLPLSAFGIDRTSLKWRGMNDEQILEILQKEKLDEIIGYRIPTEGKQSMAIMKVVGFTPDSMGSTIIVPNDWVSQTGSDFDIDSVYGIQFNTYFDKDGNIHRIPYDKNKKPTYKDYYRYVNHIINDIDLSEETRQEIKTARKKITDRLQQTYTLEKGEYTNLVASLDTKYIRKEAERLYEESEEEDNDAKYDKSAKLDIIADLYDSASKLISDAKKFAQSQKFEKARDYEANRHLNVTEAIKALKSNIDSYITDDEIEQQAYKEVSDKLQKIIDVSQKLYNYYTNQIDIDESAARSIANSIEKEVGDAKIMTYREWAAQPASRRATKRERDNGILQAMLDILSSDYSLEEQLQRSNFDDISYALEHMLPESMKGERAARSPYDIFDQIAYQEDAMSGAMLKALSVAMDTFCSICNNQKPLLRDGSEILVIYDRGDITNPDAAVNNLGTDSESSKVIDKDSKTFCIKHKKYGWSNNYKNVVGKILTSYSSETTAHILDAIKEGAVPNVNLYTFGVYKTLANLGVDFNTIISFMAQPGISSIVRNYNAGHSLFYGSSSTPFETSVKQIARRLGVKADRFDSVSSVLKELNDKYEQDFNLLFGGLESVKINLNDKNLEKLPIIASKLKDRLFEEGEFASSSPVEEINEEQSADSEDNESASTSELDEVTKKRLLFDLGTMILFHKINKVAGEVTSVAMLTNPDKFGAGKSMYAANNFFIHLYKNIFYDDTIEAERRNPILTVNGKHLLESMYPGCTDYANDKSIDSFADRIRRGIQEGNIEDSTYKTMAAHVKYGTAFSVVVGTEIIYTQDPKFIRLVYELGNYLSDNFTKDVPEDEYNNFQKYILIYVYNNLPTLNSTWSWSWNEQTKELSAELGSINEESESQRIYGYNLPTSLGIFEFNEDGSIKREIPFIVKDKNNPTDAEIKIFAKLSPAQKVKWIQANSSDAGVFKYLEANLYNPYASSEKVGMHTIQFNDTGINIDTIRMQYMNAVNSRNPFIRIAAMDLVKYAVKVEGLNFGKSTITNIIDNEVLYTPFSTKGYSFVQDINAVFNDMQKDSGILSTEEIGTIIERYLRSNLDSKNIRTFKVGKSDFNLKKAGITRISDGIFKGLYISEFKFNPNDIKEDETEEEAKARQKVEYNDKLLNAGFFKKDRIHRTYSPNRYVKIQDEKGNVRLYKIKSNDSVTIAYPLHNLQMNETSEWSANEENNTDDLWEAKFYEVAIEQAFLEGYEYQRATSIATDISNSEEFKNGKYIKRTDIKSLVEPKVVELQQKLNKDDVAFNVFKRNLQHHFVDNASNETFYFTDSVISEYITSGNKDISARVSVKLPNGDRITVNISKPKTTAIAKKQLGSALNKANEKYLCMATKEVVSMPMSNGTMSSSVIDEDPIMSNIVNLDYKAVNFMGNQRAAFGNENAVNALERLRTMRVDRTIDGIAKNTPFVTQQVSIFATKLAKDIKDRFEHFIPDPDNKEQWLEITDPKVQRLLVGNKELLNKYQKVLLDVQAFIDHFDGWQAAKSDDIDIKSYINAINKALEVVNKLPVYKADKQLLDEYITSMSTNPVVKDGLVKVMGGYYRTIGDMWKFHDILENGNILLQTILKDVMGDIEAKRIRTIRRKREFKEGLNKLINAAKEHGINIDLNKFITPDGRFLEDYSNEFIDTLEKKRLAVRDAASEFGLGSIEHLKAKNDYDKFKAFHTNQEAKQDYYIRKTHNEDIMLKEYPEIYSHYMKLYYENLDKINFQSESGIDDAIAARIDEINEEIHNLTRDNYYVDETGAYIKREHINQPNLAMTPETKRRLALYSIESQTYLKNFLKRLQELNDEYYEYVPVAGFEKKLKDNLAIIASFEKRNADGIPTVPQDVLEQNEKYKEAKNWVRTNAYFKIDYNNENVSDDDKSLGTKVLNALNSLYMGNNGKFTLVNDILRKASNDSTRTVRDEYGVIDGSKLTDDEVKKIREEVERKYKYNQAQPFTDRTLINSAPRNSEIYKEEFYNPARTNGEDNPKYLELITLANNILRKYYNEVTDTVDFSRMDGSIDSINELKTLANIFKQLRRIKKKVGSTNGQEAKEWIEEHCDFEYNRAAFLTQFDDTSRRDSLFKEAWRAVNYEYDFEGNLVKDEQGRPVPNRLLYAVMKPKDEFKEEFLDKNKTEAMLLVNSVFRTVPTSYYYQARNAAEEKAKHDPSYNYNDWFNANHIYNPYTHKMEPLPHWVKKEIRDEAFDNAASLGEWVPKASQREKKVRDGMINGVYVYAQDKRNHKYDENLSNAENYILGSNAKYDNPIKLNDDEKAVRDYLKQTLMQTATTDQARRYFQRGYLPARAKQPGLSNGKQLVKEVGKLFGFGLSTNNGDKEFFEEVGYSEDVTPLMPMTQLLRTTDSLVFDKPKPKRSDFASTDAGSTEYQKELEKWTKEKEEIDKHNRDVHNNILDKDWIGVISDYLDAAGRYNAIQDNKIACYYLLDKLRKQKAYILSHNKGENLKKDDRKGDKDNPVFDTSVDDNLIKQYENWLRRLFFDQWKEPTGNLTKYANNLQNFTSANYMMLNIKGGIANVTLGETNILAEAAAGEYFGFDTWRKGTNDWAMGLISYGRAMYSDFSYSVQDAIIKTFKVVDYDEHTGVVREAEYAKYSKRLRDAMFLPQTMGEHFMQNSILFAMLHSHKLVEIPNDPKGIGMTYMNQAEYLRVKESEYLNTILNEEQMQRFNKYKEDISKDPNELAEYAWFRKDALMRFVYLECSEEQRKKFLEDRKALRKRLIEEFNNMPSMRSQMKLGTDGQLAFVEGSQLDKLHHKFLNNGVSYAESICGDFSERVRLVNNKIHGVYNRLGSAYIEKTWVGSLIMQYHKHLPTGILKRYMKRGHYNEIRGSVDKGMIWSIADFLSLNLDKIKHDAKLTDANIGALRNLQFMLGHSLQFVMQLKTTYSMLTDYDKANLRRNFGDLVGVLLACSIAFLLILAGDDDDEDSIAYNTLLYEADRLASEAFLYNPVGLVNEGKKLLSTPIAATSIIGDAFSTIGALANIILEGEEYDPYYRSGRFAGQHKLSVYIQRRIPIWSQIISIINMPEDNHYYKRGQNPLGIFDIKEKAEAIKLGR